jgi:MFS transporter, OFA family, oxalate/formate antiporter
MACRAPANLPGMNRHVSIYLNTVRGTMSARITDSHKTESRSSLFTSYVIMINVSLVMIAAGISRGAFGIFFKPMVNDLGWSAAEISGTFSFSVIIEGIVSIISGWLSDKFGTKIVLICAGILSGSGLALMSLVHAHWQMYLIYGLAMGIGLGGIFVPIVSLLARRFTARRSSMTGIALSALGIGQLTSPLLAQSLITAYEWRMSYIILGIMLFLLLVIPAQFLKRPRTKPEVKPVDTPGHSPKPGTISYTFKEARHTRTFWMMIIMCGMYGFGSMAITVHLVPYAIESGISAATAAGILAGMGGANVAGRLGLGAIADRIGNKRIILLGMFLLTVSFLWLIQATEVWSLILFSIVCGLGTGGISSSQSPLAARFFGPQSHGSTFGAIGGGSVVMGAAGPFVVGLLFDLTGHYQIPFLVCALAGLIGAVLCILLKPPRKKASV